MERSLLLKNRLATALVACLPLTIFGQKEVQIMLQNPSFEDLPRCCEAPRGWYNCGEPGESPPDIQPGYFSVSRAPSHGESYLGLVVRDNETWEGVSQRLPRPLEVNQCYDFSLDLARSELYLSLSRTTGEETNYAVPATLRIYGGMGYCDKKELLAQSSVITNTRWLTYNFRLSPKKGSYTFILIEAYFKTPILFPTNGNILVDNATPIVQVPCEEKIEEPAVVAVPAAQPMSSPIKTPTNSPVKHQTNTTNTPLPTPPTVASSEKFDRKNIKAGLTIPVENIFFQADRYDIKPESENGLNEIYRFLISNPDVKIEVGGHTNNIPEHNFCDSLSVQRARAVTDWLMQHGIPAERVQYKGYGKRKPLVPNTNPENRRKNQRVEVKILDMNG